MGELKQTKGYANLRGVIGGLNKIKEDIQNGKDNRNYMDGEKIKKLKFSVKTAEDNMIFVEMKQFKTCLLYTSPSPRD